MNLFVYGTLTDPDRVATVVDRFAVGPDAVLAGLERTTGRSPTLVPGGRAAGHLLWAGAGRPLRGRRRGAVRPGDGRRGGWTAGGSGLCERLDPCARLGSRRGRRVEDGRRRRDDGRGRDWSTVERVATHVGDPDRLGGDARWPGDGPFDRQVRRDVRERSPVVRPMS